MKIRISPGAAKHVSVIVSSSEREIFYDVHVGSHVLLTLSDEKEEFYAKTISELPRDSWLRRYFTYFRQLLPDHPSPENTIVALHRAPWMSTVAFYWMCMHYERVHAEDIAALLHFMMLLAQEIESSEYLIEHLCTNDEMLILKFYTRRIGKFRSLTSFDSCRT